MKYTRIVFKLHILDQTLGFEKGKFVILQKNNNDQTQCKYQQSGYTS